MKTSTKGPRRNPRPLQKRKTRKAPTTANQYFAQSESFQDTWNRVVRVISKMRSERLSLKKAAKEVGISPRTVARLSGRALRKGANGRYTPAARDSLLRVMQVLTPEGPREFGVRSSRQASTLAQYWVAVHKYLQTGDASEVETLRGKFIKDANGTQVPLITDLGELNRLGSAGVLSFESLYARSK